jgi:hypothetical protein
MTKSEANEHFKRLTEESQGLTKNRRKMQQKLEAASGFEPLHRGFADLSLNHLGTPP